MTCIVAIEHKGQVLLGSDSFLGGAYIKDVIDRPKFFKISEGFAIAFAGGLRPAQVLEHEVKFPKQRKGQADEKYLVSVASAIRKSFDKEGALLKDQETGQQTNDSLFIVALHGKAYIMQEDFSIIRSSTGYCSIGAGSDFATAVLMVLHGIDTGMSFTIEDCAKKALEVATTLSPQVCAPHHLMWV